MYVCLYSAVAGVKHFLIFLAHNESFSDNLVADLYCIEFIFGVSHQLSFVGRYSFIIKRVNLHRKWEGLCSTLRFAWGPYIINSEVDCVLVSVRSPRHMTGSRSVTQTVATKKLSHNIRCWTSLWQKSSPATVTTATPKTMVGLFENERETLRLLLLNKV